MEKKITFDKKIGFPSMIGEISAISLEHNLKFIDEENVTGDLLLNGKYKITEASRLEEDFSYKIPVEVSLLDKIDLNTSKVEITDFYYELEDNDTMVCHIEISIQGEEIVTDEELGEDRECDGDQVEEKEIEIPVKENVQEIEEREEEIDIDDTIESNNGNDSACCDSLFVNMSDESDSYGTFIVYIIRENESVNTIIEKYNTTLEELELYNDLSNLSIGTKIIIPFVNE